MLRRVLKRRRIFAVAHGLAVVLGLGGAGCGGPRARGLEAPESAAPVRNEPAQPRIVAEAPPTERAPTEPLGAEPATQTGSLAVLAPELRERFAAIRPDPPPERLVRDTHYWISNEQSHFLWHEYVVRMGGAFVGVGTDQNYLLAGWARSELLVLIDFDDGVAALHRAYGVIFRDAATPAEFLARWSAEREVEVEARLRAVLSVDSPAEVVEGAAQAYRSARPLVADRLAVIDARYRALGIPTFLSDPEEYEHLRALWRSGRVVAVRGDLTAEVTMTDVAAALHAAGIEVGVLYLSNAEQYFRYDPQFRANISALPMASDGVVLRTHGWRQFPYVADEDYHYNVQPAWYFAKQMAKGGVWGVAKLLEGRRKTGIKGLSLVDGYPPEASHNPSAPTSR